MSSIVSQFVTKILCENHGCLEFKQLKQIVDQKFTVADEVLTRILNDGGKIVIIEGKRTAAGCIMSPDSVIVAKTSLRVCQTSPGDCTQCDSLHLCRYYVCGHCIFGVKCKNVHKLDSPSNLSLLSSHGLQSLVEKELFSLLLQNDPYLLPEICLHYNKGVAEHGTCKFKTSCIKLHLCLHFLQGDCRFGPSCKRAHSFDGAALKILKGRGLSSENQIMLKQIYKNRLLIQAGPPQPLGTDGPSPPSCISPRHPAAPGGRQPCISPRHPAAPGGRQPCISPRHPAAPGGRQPCISPQHQAPPEDRKRSSNSTSEGDKNEICLFFIRRHCSFKDQCVRVHFHLPYKWQIQDRDEVTWRDLPNMEDIEMAYCDPRTDDSGGILAVNFLTMEMGSSRVRRLSTSSSVTKPPHFILTTQWLWHWKDELGQWLEFGQGDSDGVASITSSTLENVFQADIDTEISFSVGKHKYILYLKEMYQLNVTYKTKREVRRRPHFLSGQDVEAKLKCSGSIQLGSSESSSSCSVEVPPHWDKTALADFTYKLVRLPGTQSEYKMVEKLFRSTMTTSTIHSIKRIQNPALWRVFQWQKEQMKQRNGGKTVDERHLFHGTDSSLIDAICEQNFDWRVCGTNGTLYGKGSYFARDALYSSKYAQGSGSKSNIMFVALVLVGEFTRGSGTFVKPPTKSTGKGFYDSCVDHKGDPSIFVVFEKHQIYPEYIIKYS
ncbi:protein mono-ADP-ribosyltransferase PARP12 isoform X2 [Hypomesus transpacificus]|uniref:protein mono-ADP-ribosyltransferase PARP12 isoform X2 n=1 Tax=Hypomesus transpacificus TaxID=137520 RepID=UPI001F0833AA|nr:protein mono-ADP-ribosyltransferase PARP12 isoform X2 [Hypomesus transpacificus]